MGRNTTNGAIRGAAVIALLLVVALLPQPHAAAAVDRLSDRVSLLTVYSPSMDRYVQNHVLHPPGAPAGLPTLYLLPGVGGAEDGISWYNHGNVREFFADKRVNVVLPIGGRNSLMADWTRHDPVLGNNKWETYLTRELPDAVRATSRPSPRSALGGVSMSAGPALTLATRNPQLYEAVAAFSGCPATVGPLGIAATTALVAQGGGNPANLWGPIGGPEWVAHDPNVNAERLRGMSIYMSAASGVPGAIDGNDVTSLAGAVTGAPIEAYALACTTLMSDRLNQLGIGHTFTMRPQGSHSWGLFAADLRRAWPQIAAALHTPA